MIESVILFLSEVPRPIATMILAAMPIFELRLAIPVAAHVWLLQPLEAFGYAVIGNLVPLVPLYFGLDALHGLATKHWPWFGRIMELSIQRAKGKVKHKYARYGAFALFLFTALPLPMTGLWTATLAAVALKVPFRYAIRGIIPGVITAGIIVSILSVSADVYF
ncbi:small multi-drug export protein [Candidatus Uhrbacteria bacterium]|jgi:uncharacterized membrane protein|nr:small multi-drug export protein [Candidatus Uhrbacteria bacterium]